MCPFLPQTHRLSFSYITTTHRLNQSYPCKLFNTFQLHMAGCQRVINRVRFDIVNIILSPHTNSNAISMLQNTTSDFQTIQQDKFDCVFLKLKQVQYFFLKSPKFLTKMYCTCFFTLLDLTIVFECCQGCPCCAILQQPLFIIQKSPARKRWE